jgi:hypothetical protein
LQQLNRTAPSWGSVLASARTVAQNSGLAQTADILKAFDAANNSLFAKPFSGVPLRRLTLSRLVERIAAQPDGMSLQAPQTPQSLTEVSSQLAKLTETPIKTAPGKWAWLVLLMPASEFRLGNLPGMPSDARDITIEAPTFMISNLDLPQFALQSILPQAPPHTFPLLRKGLNAYVRLQLDGALEGVSTINADNNPTAVLEAEGYLGNGERFAFACVVYCLSAALLSRPFTNR